MIDIKNMARSQKRRVTSRLSTETDVEESLLASSRPSALRDVVLPDPDKAQPVRLATESDAEVATTAAAAGETERKGGAPWLAVAAAVLLLGGGGAAAWYFTRGPGASDETQAAAGQQTVVAQAETETPAGGAGGAAGLAEPEQPEPGAIATDDDEDEEATAGDSADPTPPAETEPAGEPEAEPDKADHKPDKEKDRKVARNERRGKKSDHRRPEPKKDDAKKDEPKKSDQPTGDLDSLLDKAAGERREAKKAEKKDEDKSSAPKGKNKLNRAEVQGGMRSVKGRVAACYERFKQPGTVQVKVVISNTGVVTKAVAVGKFANTDTGACVAKAVSTATFPEFNGPSMSLSYPFLLQ